MESNSKYQLKKLAEETAKKIRRKRYIPGWHEDESQFPQCDYEAVTDMLEKAYRLGEKSASENENVRIFPFCKKNGGVEIPMVAIFNKENLREKDVENIVGKNSVGDHPDILIVDKGKWLRIFGGRSSLL